MSAPERLGDDVLIGEGLRKVKVGWIEVQVYRLSFYVDAPAAAEVLHAFKGLDHPSLCKDDAFYRGLVEGRFRKTFWVTFLRSVVAGKLKTGFRDPLSSRISSSESGAVERLISALPDVNEGDVVKFQMHCDGETVELCGTKVSEPVLVKSQQVWRAVQMIYFDVETEFVDIKRGSVERLPQILSSVEPRFTETTQAEIQNVEPRLTEPTPTTVSQIGRSESAGLVASFLSCCDEPREGEESATILGPFVLSIEWLCVEHLRSPAYRFGDVTKKMFSSKPAPLLSSVYALVSFGGKERSTGCLPITSTTDRVQLPDSEFKFRYAGERQLQVQIFDRREMQAALRGDPLIGEVVISLESEAALSSRSDCLEQSVPITRKGEIAGLLTLRYRLKSH